MRYKELLELAGVKRFADMTATEILDHFKQSLGGGGSKIQVLGSGYFGSALQIGSNVYKLWMQDSAYTDFVKYCLNNPNNPFLPKFMSGIKRMPAFFIRHEEAPDYVNYIKMEKLFDGRGTDTTHYIFDLKIEFEDEDDEDENGHLAVLYVSEAIALCERCGDTVIPPLNEFVNKLNGLRGHTYTEADLSADLKVFINTMMDIKNLGHRFDLHSKNLMLRANGQLVIVDPIANRDDLSLAARFLKFDEKLFHDDGKAPARRTSTATSPDVTEGQQLNELVGVKRFADMTTDDILAYYRNKLGDGPVKLIGDGQHGAAVQIGQNIYKMWLRDSAYTDFVKFALQHQDNPFLPRFMSGIKTMPAFFRRSSKAPDVISYVKMEKLSPLNKSFVFHLNMSGPDSDLFSTVTLSQFLVAMTSTFDSIEPSFDVFVERLSEEMDYELSHANIGDDMKLLVKTILAVMSFNPQAEHTLDIHLGNFMMRGEQLVLLDPIHNWTDTDINDEFYDWNANWGPHSGMGKPGVTSKHVQRKRDELEDDEWPQDEDEDQ